METLQSHIVQVTSAAAKIAAKATQDVHVYHERQRQI